jgi:hypothetical protein
MNEWPLERVEDVHSHVVSACVAALDQAAKGIVVARGPKGGVYIVYIEDGFALPDTYFMLTTETDVREECTKDLESWRDRGPKAYEKMRRQIREGKRSSFRRWCDRKLHNLLHHE